MLIERFVTKTWKGKLNLDKNFHKEYSEWVNFEKTLDNVGRTDSTTVGGWQYSFDGYDKTPSWFFNIKPQIDKVKEEIGFKNIKSSWVIEYEPGGYQDPHVHQPRTNLVTIIFNLCGYGDLLLFDPRPMAVNNGYSIVEEEHLEPGDWIAIPGWVVHNTRPCSEHRSILVIDGYD